MIFLDTVKLMKFFRRKIYLITIINNVTDSAPGNLTASRTPQLVVLTFDDSVNDLNKRLYQDIFHPSRKNPNGCPIAATFYVR